MLQSKLPPKVPKRSSHHAHVPTRDLNSWTNCLCLWSRIRRRRRKNGIIIGIFAVLVGLPETGVSPWAACLVPFFLRACVPSQSALRTAPNTQAPLAQCHRRRTETRRCIVRAPCPHATRQGLWQWHAWMRDSVARLAWRHVWRQLDRQS